MQHKEVNQWKTGERDKDGEQNEMGQPMLSRFPGREVRKNERQNSER